MTEPDENAGRCTEGAIARSLPLVEQVFQQTEAGLFLFNADDYFVRVNPAFARIFGYEPHEMEGRHAALILSPEDVEANNRRLEALKRGETPGPREFSPIARDGSRRSVRSSPTRVIDVDGETLYLGTVIDITERKLAEARLRDTEARFQQLADNIIQLVWMADGDGRTFWQNRRCLEYTGATLEQMEARGWSSALHPDESERVFEKWTRHLRTGQEWEDTFQMRGVDGSYRWFLSRAFPIHGEGGEVVRWFGTSTDVNDQLEFASERERHLTEVEGLNSRLRRAMQETHHRIKNNLQIVAALIEIRTSGAGATIPTAELRQLEQHICALAVIHDLLANSAQTSAEADELPIRVALDRLRATLAPMLRERRLVLDVDDVRLPARQVVSLALMVDELVLNALKYGRGDMDVSLAREGATVRLTFTDQGAGFPPGFQPASAGSTGFELLENLARMDLQGTLAFQNSPAGGAQVVVTFPMEAAVVRA